QTFAERPWSDWLLVRRYLKTCARLIRTRCQAEKTLNIGSQNAALLARGLEKRRKLISQLCVLSVEIPAHIIPFLMIRRNQKCRNLSMLRQPAEIPRNCLRHASS